jgi:hypothetical protein
MRYFRRAGSGCVLQETSDRARYVKGPDEDGPGDIVSYNEAYPEEKVWAEQLASDYNWVEVDRNGDLPAPPPPRSLPVDLTELADADPLATEPAESE